MASNSSGSDRGASSSTYRTPLKPPPLPLPPPQYQLQHHQNQQELQLFTNQRKLKLQYQDEFHAKQYQDEVQEQNELQRQQQRELQQQTLQKQLQHQHQQQTPIIKQHQHKHEQENLIQLKQFQQREQQLQTQQEHQKKQEQHRLERQLHVQPEQQDLSVTPAISPGNDFNTKRYFDTSYNLKFGINVPYSDLRKLVETGAQLSYQLDECSRAGRVNWTLGMRRYNSPESAGDQPSQPTTANAADPYVSLYLKFEPQTCAESASCSVEFAVQIVGPNGRSVERRSNGRRQFDRRSSCRGWTRFTRASELHVLASTNDGEQQLNLSGVLHVLDASKLLYPARRHNFARCQLGADFRLRVQLAIFHVHRSVLALNSDHFASLLAQPDCLEARQGQAVLSEDRIQDVHLMLQFMYPGYADVLDDETLKPLSRLAAKYQVHTLAWSIMQYIDSKLSDEPAPDAERALLYYSMCQEWLQCPDLAEQCVQAAACLPWFGGVREARHFRELDEANKAAFLQAYLDFKEAPTLNLPQPSRVAAKTGQNDEEKLT